jgi:hypothetical protein
MVHCIFIANVGFVRIKLRNIPRYALKSRISIVGCPHNSGIAYPKESSVRSLGLRVWHWCKQARPMQVAYRCTTVECLEMHVCKRGLVLVTTSPLSPDTRKLALQLILAHSQMAWSLREQYQHAVSESILSCQSDSFLDHVSAGDECSNTQSR